MVTQNPFIVTLEHFVDGKLFNYEVLCASPSFNGCAVFLSNYVTMHKRYNMVAEYSYEEIVGKDTYRLFIKTP